MKAVLLLAMLIALAAPGARADLYKCQDKEGKVAYQAEPCPTSGSEKRITAPAAAPSGAAPSSGKGWDPKVLESMREGCVREAYAGAKRGWNAAGDSRPCPESEGRRAVLSHCDCVLGRVRQVPFEEYSKNPAAYLTRYANDAANGGQCKVELDVR
jgi:hypothetical protein